MAGPVSSAAFCGFRVRNWSHQQHPSVLFELQKTNTPDHAPPCCQHKTWTYPAPLLKHPNPWKPPHTLHTPPQPGFFTPSAPAPVSPSTPALALPLPSFAVQEHQSCQEECGHGAQHRRVVGVGRQQEALILVVLVRPHRDNLCVKGTRWAQRTCMQW